MRQHSCPGCFSGVRIPQRGGEHEPQGESLQDLQEHLRGLRVDLFGGITRSESA